MVYLKTVLTCPEILLGWGVLHSAIEDLGPMASAAVKLVASEGSILISSYLLVQNEWNSFMLWNLFFITISSFTQIRSLPQTLPFIFTYVHT